MKNRCQILLDAVKCLVGIVIAVALLLFFGALLFVPDNQVITIPFIGTTTFGTILLVSYAILAAVGLLMLLFGWCKLADDAD